LEKRERVRGVANICGGWCGLPTNAQNIKEGAPLLTLFEKWPAELLAL
jgi:hypothetical protein